MKEQLTKQKYKNKMIKEEILDQEKKINCWEKSSMKT
jgi:hypothetical protein